MFWCSLSLCLSLWTLKTFAQAILCIKTNQNRLPRPPLQPARSCCHVQYRPWPQYLRVHARTHAHTHTHTLWLTNTLTSHALMTWTHTVADKYTHIPHTWHCCSCKSSHSVCVYSSYAKVGVNTEKGSTVLWPYHHHRDSTKTMDLHILSPWLKPWGW